MSDYRELELNEMLWTVESFHDGTRYVLECATTPSGDGKFVAYFTARQWQKFQELVKP